jgi:hypothetical protein
MRLRRALARPAPDFILFLRAFGLVVSVRIALWVLPSRLLLRHVARRVRRAPAPADTSLLVKRIGWAVRAASRRVPDASCLTQALSVQLLLARHGYSSELKIGVLRDSVTGFAAHAWVLVDGQVLVGGRGVDRYRELPDITAGL